MARQKNDGKGRLGGRQKGTPNKVTSNVREWLFVLINKNRKQIERDIKALEPKDRLQILEKLMQYVVPKQTINTTVDIERLSNEQLDNLIQELTKNIDDETNNG